MTPERRQAAWDALSPAEQATYWQQRTQQPAVWYSSPAPATPPPPRDSTGRAVVTWIFLSLMMLAALLTLIKLIVDLT